MRLFLLGCLSIVYGTSYAQEVISLDKLFEINSKNFCYQLKEDKVKGFINFFNVSSNNKITLGNQKVDAISFEKPILQINETGEHLKYSLFKYNPNKYTQYDLSNNRIKNIYTINYSINLELTLTPLQIISLLSKKYPGINFKNDKYAGDFTFSPVKRPDFDKANNLKEFNQLLEDIPSAAYSFEINPTSIEKSVINYKCQMVILTPKSAQEIAIDLVD